MKLKSILVTGLCVGALALGLAPRASAQDSSPAPEASASASPAKTKSHRGIPYRGKIASVDQAAKTFTINTKSGQSRVFTVNDETRIMKDGAPAMIGDLAAEQMVRGQYMKNDDGTMVAKSVMIGAKGGRHMQHGATSEEASPSATP